jgi:formylglycine-generating enzyme required for sulfatase activity
MNQVRKLAGAGLLLALLVLPTACPVDGGGGGAGAAVYRVSLNKTSLTLEAGGTETLIARVEPEDAADKSVRWESDNPAAATVSEGLVSAAGAGTAIITATTADGGYTAKCTVSIPGIRTLSGKAVSFRYVPAGSFRRGSTAANVSVITRGYWMSETEVTQELFEAVMGANPSYFDGTSGREAAVGEAQNQRPVEQVSWYDAIAFCNKLSLADNEPPRSRAPRYL